MSLLIEIRNGALDTDKPLADVLRRCLMLGHRMGYAPLAEWAQRELRGYELADQLPPYRMLTGQLTGDFVAPGVRITSRSIDMTMFSEAMAEEIVTLLVRQDVATLSRWELRERNRLTPVHNNVAAYITYHSPRGVQCTDVWLELDPAEISGLLSQVRNRVVEFTLNIEEDIGGAPVSDISSKPEIMSHINNVFQNNFFGDADHVVTGAGRLTSTSIAIDVKIGDVDSLSEFMHRQGIADSDIERLKRILQPEKVEEGPNNNASRIREWVVEQADRAAEGTADVAKDAVKQSMKEGLVTAIKLYAPQAVAHLSGLADDISGLV